MSNLHLSTYKLPETDEKPVYIRDMFQRLSGYYDLMNDVMTLGLHRLWKKKACRLLELKADASVLDVCCGTGDLTFYLKSMYPAAEVVGLDFCEDMLVLARERNAAKNIPAEFIQGDAMALPFEDNHFNGLIISYGLRNVANYEKCLIELMRVVKPGSKIVILDMSYPTPFIHRISSFHRYSVMPIIGKLLVNDSEAYRYLFNSIYYFMPQKELVQLMEKVGLRKVQYQNLIGGICALHWGTKPAV